MPSFTSALRPRWNMALLSIRCASIGWPPSMRHIIWRISATETGDVLSMNKRAIARAAGSSSSGGTTRVLVGKIGLTVRAVRHLRPVGTCFPIERARAGRKIRARAKRPARSGHEDRAHCIVRVRHIERIDQLADHLGVERVELV